MICTRSVRSPDPQTPDSAESAAGGPFGTLFPLGLAVGVSAGVSVGLSTDMKKRAEPILLLYVER